MGAGTVLDGETARAAILAGAQFIVGPGFDSGLVKVCNTYGVVVMPGAFTPTEIITAWKSGADIVKIFPGDIGGPAYLKTIKGPLPQVELMPTGGVDFDTAASFIKAGAIAVGAGRLVGRQGAHGGQGTMRRSPRTPGVFPRSCARRKKRNENNETGKEKSCGFW